MSYTAEEEVDGDVHDVDDEVGSVLLIIRPFFRIIWADI